MNIQKSLVLFALLYGLSGCHIGYSVSESRSVYGIAPQNYKGAQPAYEGNWFLAMDKVNEYKNIALKLAQNPIRGRNLNITVLETDSGLLRIDVYVLADFKEASDKWFSYYEKFKDEKGGDLDFDLGPTHANDFSANFCERQIRTVNGKETKLIGGVCIDRVVVQLPKNDLSKILINGVEVSGDMKILFRQR